ncbi:RNA polymerase subunit sigma [Pseudoflavonifractor phocaeensis]|uniref:sigma factor n=1 Tax=Pseudoflavonifractor phocaeensis TaxID=1870988 RepID=UPI00195A036B|nr:sigma factor [Pseudoflavonifractor phocaeensis]MBM6870181.1 RNA polymerase subunit sigma [Pseudoflavonifractor phocaeensis]MBM6938391.1 RNA polymerase subunit sigma [Pseudoflavonifractor phocaeensis]
MNEGHDIIQQVCAAKKDMRAADDFISAYMPFIKAETAKFLKRPPIEGRDDELSIAMLSFYEAIRGYARERGGFLRYASILIRSRLIDYHRQERRHSDVLSIHAPAGEEALPLEDTLADRRDHSGELVEREATREEIRALTRQMAEFGVSLGDVADNCPRQQRTLEACRRALQYARVHPELLEELLRTKRLPMARLAGGSGVERKTLERHRSYMIALLLIYTNGYDIIRGHLKQVLKGTVVR